MFSRHHFLKRLRVFSSRFLSSRKGNLRYSRLSSPLLAPRRKLANPFITADGRPLLVCVQGRNRAEMMKKGFLALGGLGRLGIDNREILIKPNLIMREPTPGFPNYPTMSNPECIADLIGILQTETGSILVGDQGCENQDMIFTALGLERIVSQAGGRLINFEQQPVPVCRVRHSEWDASTPDFHVFSAAYDASLVFNLCNLKRHFRAYMTCALKNLVGAIEGRLSWGTRGFLHRNPDMSEAFLRELAYPASLINPEVTIVDAIDIMVGNGPFLSNSGARIEQGVDRMVISGDMVAADSYCAERILLKYDPGFILESIYPTLLEAEKLGLGTADLSKVEILEIDEKWEDPGK
jgi:uncharacterized protein (DUF362 family)